MTEHELTADKIAGAGTSFGARMIVALEAVDDCARHAGIGMTWAHYAEDFEIALDRVTDRLTELCYTEEAVTLFIAQARLTFYGLQAGPVRESEWKRESWDAWDRLAHPRAAA